MAGSNSRQRNRVVTLRLSEAEHDRLQARAAEAGLSVGAFARKAMLGSTGPRVRRQPTAPRDELRRLKGELARVGNNINQIAYVLNSGGLHEPGELTEALDDLALVNRAIRQALGYEPPETVAGDDRPEDRA